MPDLIDLLTSSPLTSSPPTQKSAEPDQFTSPAAPALPAALTAATTSQAAKDPKDTLSEVCKKLGYEPVWGKPQNTKKGFKCDVHLKPNLESKLFTVSKLKPGYPTEEDAEAAVAQDALDYLARERATAWAGIRPMNSERTWLLEKIDEIMDDQLIDKLKRNPEVTDAFLEGVVIGRRLAAAEGSASRADGRHAQSQQAHVQLPLRGSAAPRPSSTAVTSGNAGARAGADAGSGNAQPETERTVHPVRRPNFW